VKGWCNSVNFHNASFHTSVFDIRKLPLLQKAEIVFAGRSNVGKSSMINKILNRKGIARTSATPGKTASINFYNIDQKVFLVDLPGYGYAKKSDKEKENWSLLIEGYFNSERRIDQVFLLVDSRHEPTRFDIIMKEFLDATGLEYIVVLTKCDKLSQKQLTENTQMIAEKLGIEDISEIIHFSSLNGKGREQMLKIIEDIAELENVQ